MTQGDVGKRDSRGFALIAVVWFLVLIAAIGTYLMANARSETALARNVRAAAHAEALADAGVAEAVFNRTDPRAPNRWALDGEPHAIAWAGGEITIRLYDESAKINPNHAPDALLTGLFQALGVDRARARRLGAAVADWVGSGAEARPLGAKLEQYQAAGRSYGPPNAPLETLDDLNLVLGMTPQLFALARPYLTIYTQSEQPTSALLHPIVRRALALAVREPARETAVSEATQTSQDPDAPPPPVASQPTSPLKPDEEVLDLEVLARSADGGVFARHAVVRLDPRNPKGYAVLDWRRSEFSD